MGGPMSVNDPLPWIAQEVDVIRRAFAAHIPVLGICLGSQLMAKALGAKVFGGPCMELGWLPIHKTRESLWSEALPDQFDVFHWHGETFELPDGAELLFASDKFAHQGFALGPHLALQFHVEVTAEMIEQWLQLNAADLPRRCYAAHDAAAIRAQTPARIATLHKTADRLLGQWLAECK
jgi:GMP synthase-like glutamine amidotransferase